MNNISSEFITFSNSGYRYSPNCIKFIVNNMINKSEDINILYVKHTDKIVQSKIINLENFKEKIPFELWGLVFRTNLIKNITFNEMNDYISIKDILFKVLLQSRKYLLLEDNMENNKIENIDKGLELKKYWYIDYLKYIKQDLIPYINENIGYILYIFNLLL